MSFELYISILIALIVIAIIISSLHFHLVTKKDFKQKLQSDITTEQMLESEKRIEAFYHEKNLHPGCALDRIADALLVKMGHIDHALINDQAHISKPGPDGYRVVDFKSGLNEAEKRFAYAHECAHVLNNDDIPATRPDGHNKPPCEQIADYTAAAFLMPYDDVLNMLNKYNYTSSSKNQRIRILRLLCKQYNVSEMVAIRRVLEVNNSTVLNKIEIIDDFT